MTTDPDAEKIESALDRPLECSACRKPIAIKYSILEKGERRDFVMCADCPELRRRLHGANAVTDNTGQDKEAKTGLACGDCGTTLEDIMVGHALGCSHCYEIFAEAIVSELVVRKKIISSPQLDRKHASIHVGRSPGEAVEVNPSLQLIALNEALTETLKREDYEQAAMIRDQINALTEEQGDKTAESSDGEK